MVEFIGGQRPPLGGGPDGGGPLGGGPGGGAPQGPCGLALCKKVKIINQVGGTRRGLWDSPQARSRRAAARADVEENSD